MLAPFEAPRLKIARATKHLDEIADAVDTYLRGEPLEMVVEDWPTFSGSLVWVVHIKRPVPASMSAIIGDVIHNLRTALDLTASDLVRLAGKSTKGVYFPIADTASGLDELIKAKNFHRAGPDAVRLLKALEPYQGGRAALRELHELDVKDKHLALLPVAQGWKIDVSWLLPKDAPPKGLEQMKKWSSKIEKDEQIAFVVVRSHSPPAGTKIKANWLLTLDHGELVGRIELVAALKQFSNVVESVVCEFERLQKP